MLGKPDPKPAFRDEMTGFRKARRFQRDYLAIIDFYNVGAGLAGCFGSWAKCPHICLGPSN
jgi:hypothetical protein